ncbi:MAG: PHP domain-containing protein [Nostocoides sp.]
MAHTPLELQAPIGPVEALRRVAYLMERDRAGSYRVDAFRKALALLKAMPEAELAAHGDADDLTELAGIGPSTAEVISAAQAGGMPPRLARLQDGARVPLAAGGTDLWGAIIGDCHSHSTWSDGGSPIDEMVLAAIDLGQQWLVLTDHSPSLRVARGLSAERLAHQLAVIDAINAGLTGAFTLLKGIEVDILEDGQLDQSEELLDQLDIVTASVHSKLRMPAEPMTRRMVAAVTNPRVNVLGHCTGRLVEGSRGTRPASDFDAREVFAACAEHDVAVEINSRPERCDPPDELITLAADLGCLFAIDSDAHAPGQLEMKAYGCERADRLGIPPARIVTTWGLPQLRAWAGSS